MDERLRFVARLLEGEKMAVLCREFDISRKTGYKIFQRYKDCGLQGLTDRSRRPYRHANKRISSSKRSRRRLQVHAGEPAVFRHAGAELHEDRVAPAVHVEP